MRVGLETAVAVYLEGERIAAALQENPEANMALEVSNIAAVVAP